MAHVVRAFPKLTGEAAKKFQDEAHRVDTALTQEEKEATRARLRRALRFLKGENNVHPLPAE